MSDEHRDSFVCALLVGAGAESRLLIQEVFRNAGWRLYEARSRKQALACLARFPLQVVIAAGDSPEYSWKRAWHDLARLPHPPQLVVMSHAADDSLWSEVLNWGGYDVLREPLEREEVARVIASAGRHYSGGGRRLQAAAAS